MSSRDAAICPQVWSAGLFSLELARFFLQAGQPVSDGSSGACCIPFNKTRGRATADRFNCLMHFASDKLIAFHLWSQLSPIFDR